MARAFVKEGEPVPFVSPAPARQLSLALPPSRIEYCCQSRSREQGGKAMIADLQPVLEPQLAKVCLTEQEAEPGYRDRSRGHRYRSTDRRSSENVAINPSRGC